MAKRSHNETFILLRNNAQKNRSFYKDFTKDDERVKLVSAGDDYEEDGDVCDLEISNYSDRSPANGGVGGGGGVNGYRDDASAAYPSWIASLDEFRYDAFNIKEKIEQLRKTQEEHLKKQNTAIFADDVTSGRLRDYELDIERRCQELNVLFGRLHSILKHFQTLKGRYAAAAASSAEGGGGNRMISVILRNIFQFQVQEVVHLTQLFRSCQRVYLERMTDATRVDPQFVITFDEDLLKDELLLGDGYGGGAFDSSQAGSSSSSSAAVRLMSDDAVFFEGGSGSSHNQQQQQPQLIQKQSQLAMDDQLALDAQHNSHLRERQAEMNTILKSFAELNTLFQEVNTLVVDQGSALDRIDYNIEQVEHRVELGAVSLEKAHRTITRMRKFKVILGSGLLLFIIILLIILRS